MEYDLKNFKDLTQFIKSNRNVCLYLFDFIAIEGGEGEEGGEAGGDQLALEDKSEKSAERYYLIS